VSALDNVGVHEAFDTAIDEMLQYHQGLEMPMPQSNDAERVIRLHNYEDRGTPQKSVRIIACEGAEACGWK